MLSDLTLDPSFKVKQGQRNLKVPITCLLLVLEVWDGKPSYRKSWAVNFLVWSDLIVGPLPQGQIRTAKLKSAYNSLIIGNHGLGMFLCVGFDLGPLLQGRARILHLQYFFKYVLAYFLHLDNYLVTFLHNTICRAQFFCPFLLSASELLSNMLFN